MSMRTWYRGLFGPVAAAPPAVNTRALAEGGNAEAQFNLGSRCHWRSVDPLDGDRPLARRDAYNWLRIAAGQGYTWAEAACERVAVDMSLDEVSEAGQQVVRVVPRGAVVSLTSGKTV